MSENTNPQHIIPSEWREKVILATQSGLPLVKEPYRVVAEQTGLSEEQVIATLKQLLEERSIRRIGVVPNHYAVGITFNLMTVWDIDDVDAETLGQQVGDLDFVSHCYIRPRVKPDWNYNLFAMVHGGSEDEALEKVEVIRNLLGDHCRASDFLKSKKILKKTGLRVQKLKN